MTFRLSRVRALVLAASAAVLPACVGDVVGPEGNLAAETQPLDQIFAEAAAEFGVPVDLLKAVGWAETRFTMIEADEEHEGRGAAFGVMALRGAQLTEGAALAGVSVQDAQYGERENIRAAAALLSKHADALAVDRADLAAWAPAVAAFSGIADADAAYAYVKDEVYRALNEGAKLELEGSLQVASISPAGGIKPRLPEPQPIAAGGGDYAGAVYRQSPNYSARPSGTKPVMVIIHTCEGGYAGCWGWLKNPSSGVSAHYVVNESGSEITQLVREASKAWHIAASYACSRNNNVLCSKNGQSSNNFTIGIEHGGFGAQKSWPAGQIDASARLVCDITKRHAIPRDRYHIVGHGQLQPYNRSDPGPNWPWAEYMGLINGYCGAAPPPPPAPPPPSPTPTDPPPPTVPGGTIVIDSNQANNNASVAKVSVSGNWTSSASVGGFHGTGYWYAKAQAVSDGATFSFYLPAAATRTVDAWWTAASDRSTSTPFVIFDSAGAKLGSVNKNQQTQGSQWVTLGTYSFKAGWNTVVVSRWTGSGTVIADAIRVR